MANFVVKQGTAEVHDLSTTLRAPETCVSMRFVPEATAAPIQTCPLCGFSWEPMVRSEVTERIGRAVSSFVEVMKEAGAKVAVRPTQERWSILEYGSHLRDVLLSIRERVIVASIVDVPTGTPIYRDERVDLGFYSEDTAKEVMNEIEVAAVLLAKTVTTLPAHFDTRELIYSSRTPLAVTIASTFSNAVHECEHHLRDASDNLAMFDADNDTV
jgi:hypothetical protein